MTTMLKVTTDNELVTVEVETLEEMQAEVGGYIELIALPVLSYAAAYVDEEGKFNGSQPNKIATHIWEAIYGVGTDVIMGNVLFFGGVDSKGQDKPITDFFKKTIENVARDSTSW